MDLLNTFQVLFVIEELEMFIEGKLPQNLLA
jgi:hypothetical protein